MATYFPPIIAVSGTFLNDAAFDASHQYALPILARRNDGLVGDVVSADGEYTYLQVSSEGALHVSGVFFQPSHDNLNINANLQIGNLDVSDFNEVPVGILSSVTLPTTDFSTRIDNDPFTVESHKVFPVGGLCDEIAPNIVGEGYTGLLRMTPRRNLYTAVEYSNIPVSGTLWTNTSKDGTGSTYAPLVDADGHFQVDVLTASAVNLDIRDLTSVSDSMTVLQATGTNLHAVIDSGTIAVTGVSTLSEQQTQSTSLSTIAGDTTNIETAVQLIDDSVATLGTTTYAEATTKGLVISAIRRDADTSAVNTDNEAAPLQVDANGYLKVEIFDGGGSHTVDGSVTANAGTNLNTSALATETGGNLAAAATSLAILDDWDNTASDGASVTGDVAHDSPDAGEPVKVGMKAVDVGATPTAVTANDRTNWYATRAGVPFVLGGHPNTSTSGIIITDANNAQTDLAVSPAIAAGTALVVTKLSVMADNANTVAVSVRIGFGAANTPAAGTVAGSLSTAVILHHPGIAAGSGVIEGNGSGIVGIGASDQELRVTCGDPTGGNITILVTYFTILIG